jgi:hypothetical protein
LANAILGSAATTLQAAGTGYKNLIQFGQGEKVEEGFNPVYGPLSAGLVRNNEKLQMRDGLTKEESRQLVARMAGIASGKIPSTPEMFDDATKFMHEYYNGEASAISAGETLLDASMLVAPQISGGAKGLVSSIKNSAAIGGGYGGAYNVIDQYATKGKVDGIETIDNILFGSVVTSAPTAAIGVPASTIKPIVKTTGKVVNGGINIAKDARDKVKGRVDSVKEEDLKNYEEIDPETNEPVVMGDEQPSTPIKNEEPRVSNNGEILNDELWEEFRRDPEAIKAYKQKNKEVVDKKVAEAEARIDAKREAAKVKAEETQSTEQSIIPKDEPLIEPESKVTPKEAEEAGEFKDFVSPYL